MKALVLAFALIPLSACGHTELSAPCSTGSGYLFSPAYAGTNDDNCGPMRPVNGPGDIPDVITWTR